MADKKNGKMNLEEFVVVFGEARNVALDEGECELSAFGHEISIHAKHKLATCPACDLVYRLDGEPTTVEHIAAVVQYHVDEDS